MTGIGPTQPQSKKLLRYFTGAGAVGNIITQFALLGSQRSGESVQTEEMLDPELDKTIRSLRKQTESLR
jgi:hypothetical protein